MANSVLNTVRTAFSELVNLYFDFSAAAISESNEDVCIQNVLSDYLRKEIIRLGANKEVIATILNAKIKSIHELASLGKDIKGLLKETLILIKIFEDSKILDIFAIQKLLLDMDLFLNMPFIVLHRFFAAQIVTCDQFLLRIYKEEVFFFKVEEVIKVLLVQEIDCIDGIHEFYVSLVNVSFDNQISNLVLKKQSTEALSEITKQTLDAIFEKNEDVLLRNKILSFYEKLLQSFIISSDILEKLFISHFMQFLLYRSRFLTPMNVLRDYALITTQKNSLHTDLLRMIIIVIGYKKALQIFSEIIKESNINWFSALVFITEVLLANADSARITRELLNACFKNGLRERNEECIASGLVLARHAGHLGHRIFPSYPQWFFSVFGTETKSPIKNAQDFIFFVEILAKLVPYEEAYALRAHQSSSVFYPHGCHIMWRDYIHLANSRLKDLQQMNIENTSKPDNNSTEKVKAVQDIEMAVLHYENTEKVPNFIIEASIFKEPYYVSELLPIILKPRLLPEIPDSKMKLISHLKGMKKIPDNLYSVYVKKCEEESLRFYADLAETSDLLMENDPVNELNILCSNLLESHENNLQNIEFILLKISNKIEFLLRPFKLSDSKKTFDFKVPFNFVNSIPYKVAKILFDVILNYLEKDEEVRPHWFSQYFTIFINSSEVQQGVYMYLLNQLQLCCSESLSHKQILAFGISISELEILDDVFMSCHISPSENELFFPSKLALNAFAYSSLTNLHNFCCLYYHWLLWNNKKGSHVDEVNKVNGCSELAQKYCFLAMRVISLKSFENVDFACSCICDGAGSVYKCCSFFFKNKKHFFNQVTIEKWIDFELKTFWNGHKSNFQMHLRKTFLDFKQMKTVESNLCTSEVLKNLLSTIFWRVVNNANADNYSDVIMMIQSIANEYKPKKICFLDEWHEKKKSLCKNEVQAMSLSFSNCVKCLHPSLFLDVSNMPTLVRPLEEYVDFLKNALLEPFLSLADISYLLLAMFYATEQLNCSVLGLQECFNVLRIFIIFHWEDLKWIFVEKVALVDKVLFLSKFFTDMNADYASNSSLSSKEKGVYLLRVIIDGNLSKRNLSMDKYSIYWTFLYINAYQHKGIISLFPISGEEIFNPLTNVIDYFKTFLVGNVAVACNYIEKIMHTESCTEVLINFILSGVYIILLSLLSVTSSTAKGILVGLLIGMHTKLAFIYDAFDTTTKIFNTDYLTKLSKMIIYYLKLLRDCKTAVPKSSLTDCQEEFKCMLFFS